MPEIVASDDRDFNLAKLLSVGRMSPKAKVETRKLLSALRQRDQKKILDISWNLHQNISSSMKAKQYPLREDADYNSKITGTTVYHEADMIAHGDY